MAKRKSALELAIADLEDQIAALELGRNALIRLRPTAPRAKSTPPKPPTKKPRIWTVEEEIRELRANPEAS